jgi:AcrR family transcriptional regulator
LKKEDTIKSRKSQAGVPTQIKNPELVLERRRQIVDSTVHLFVEHGYHKTTTRMIAKAAGFSIGSLYEYVGSKEDVLYLVCEAIHSEVERAVEETLSGEVRGKQTLAEVIREYFIVCDSMSDHVLLMYQVTQFLPKKWQARVLENELRITDIFVQVIQELSGKGDFPQIPAETVTMLAHNISVLGHMWGFRRWDLARHFTLDQYIDFQTDFVLGRLLA